jgi:hypothetical protein
MSQPDSDEDREKRIQRALNEAKKRQLEEKYGMQSYEGDAEIDPGVKGEFLDYVEEFERQYQSARRVMVRELLGSPVVRPLCEVPPEELDSELFRLLKTMEAHNAEVDFLCDVEPAEQYRFITEELLDEETDDIRIPGMTLHYIYEEFHPNAEYDARSAADHFVRDLLSRNTEFIMSDFSRDELYGSDGARISLKQMEEKVQVFLNTYVETEDWDVEPISCQIEGDYARVEAEVSWNGLPARANKWAHFSGLASVRLKRDSGNAWDVIQATVPGWE